VDSKLVLGLLIGLILGVVGNYIYDGLGFRMRAAKLSKRRASKRITQLTKEIESLGGLSDDRMSLVSFVLGRLLLITILWIGQSVLDYLFGLTANGAYSYITVLHNNNIGIPIDVLTSSINTTASAVGACVLLFVANFGYRTYRTWSRATNFATYSARVQGQLAELKLVT
jgi:hypothetical protein